MNKILIQVLGMDDSTFFDPNARDACTEPFIYLRTRLRELGYQFACADGQSVEDCAWVLFMNAIPDNPDNKVSYGLRDVARLIKNLLLGRKHPVKKRSLYQECIRARLRDRVVLFLWDPPANWPRGWIPEVKEMFPIVFTWHDDYVDGQKFHKFYLPVNGFFPAVQNHPFNRRKLLVNISGNKTSIQTGELFSARRETIRYFERHYPDQFDLYGEGWSEPASPLDGVRSPVALDKAFYPSYRGTVKHKWDVFPHYRFGLCYESMRDMPGLITEKIFDCMRAGTVPIYWGASNIASFVDSNAFIDRTKYTSDADLAQFLLSMSEHEYGQYRQAIQDYLSSDQFALFLPPAFADNIIRVLSL